jgi:hypothetical protein
MSTPSNLYAEKIMSEHPLAVWALDDTSDYVSLIPDSYRDISTWTGTGTEVAVSDPSAPFPDSFTTRITSPAGSASGTFFTTAPTTFSYDTDGYTIAFYIKTNSTITLQVGTTTGAVKSKEIVGSKYPLNYWIPVSFTFEEATAGSRTIKIGCTYSESGTVFSINGLSVGENSEEFNAESLGKTLSSIPSTIATTQTSGIESKSFGNKEYTAYYVGSNRSLYAKNSGISLSYGSFNSMIVYPHDTENEPSFIFPGLGFLNDAGRYKELTLEFLIRIDSKNYTPKRIIGPLASKDGVYVTNDSISLKVGDSIGSYYFPELFRPMILQVQFGEGYANLIIDGNEVITLDIDNASLSLPNKLNGSSEDQDWIGIFSYSDIVSEVDLVAIYPYKCSSVLGKRRIVYAQAIEIPLTQNRQYGGSTVSIDYGFSNYSNNYNYPSFQAKWEQASRVDNLTIVNGKNLSSTIYAKPTIFTSAYSSENLLKDVYETYVASAETSPFIRLRPGTVVTGSGRSWSANNGYIYATSFSHSEHLSNCIYGLFKSTSSVATEQILIKILNETTEDYLKISLTSTTVSYILKYNSETETVIGTQSITTGTKFAVGLDLSVLKTLNENVSLFLRDSNNLNIYIGGDSLAGNTFIGNIYKVGLSSLRDYSLISDYFNAATGIIASGHETEIQNRVATYTVSPVDAYETMLIDILTSGYWQDYVPLSRLAKNAVDATAESGESYQLKYIQLNVDYPEPKIYKTGLDSRYVFDTELSQVKTYFSFQTMESGALKKLEEFDRTDVELVEDRLIDATTWSDSLHEFVNGTTVLVPSDVDISTLALVIYVEYSSNAGSLSPIALKYIQIAAQTDTEDNQIGTKYVEDISLFGNYESLPIIYKETTPPLYLNRHSGIRLSPNNYIERTEDSGAFFEIGNPSTELSVNSIQMSILADIREFPAENTKIFEIKSNSETMSFYIKATDHSPTRGVISTTSTTNTPKYYLNGKLVAEPVITIGEWNMLGVSFLKAISFNNTAEGKFIILPTNMLMNNISYYGLNPVELGQRTVSLRWSDADEGTWNNLKSTTNLNAGLWNYIVSPSFYIIYGNNLKEIYKTYTGTNKVVSDTSGNSPLSFSKYHYIGYMDIESVTKILDAV